VVRNIATSSTGIVLNRTRQYIACADDMLVLGRTVRATEEVRHQRSCSKHWIGDK